MKKIILLVLTIILVTTLSAQVPNGTYVPKTEMAKQMPYSKFVFSGGKVHLYLGINGVSLGFSYEYAYTIKGKTITVTDGTVSVELLTYDKARDLIFFNMDAAYQLLGELGALFGNLYGMNMTGEQVSNELKKLVSDEPVWGKEGVPYEPPIVTKQKLAKPEWLQPPPQNAESNKEYQISWKPVPNAKEYRVYITQNGNVLYDSYPTNSSIKIKMPNVTGTVYIGVIAIPTSYDLYEQSDELQAPISILFSQKLAETAALYAMLAYDEMRVANLSSSLTSHETIREYAIRHLKDKEVDYYTGKRGDNFDFSNEPWLLQARLELDGYKYIESRNYRDNNEHNVSYTLAIKTENGKTQLAVIIRGTDDVEWRGNMDIRDPKYKNMDLVRHFSFEEANKNLQSDITKYINKYFLSNVDFFITGHSRGAAVANLFAVDLITKKYNPQVTVNNISAYTFATPNNSTQITTYSNIFNFCFIDDFVPQVPLEKEWGFSKSGITIYTIANDLYYNNATFNKMMDKYSNLSENRNPSFDKIATNKVMNAFYQLAPTVNIYYTKKLKMDCFLGLEYDKTLHDFMRDYIANAAIGKLSSQILTALKQPILGVNFCNEVYNIVDYFIDGIKIKQSVNDTHQAFTYYAALKAGGFLVK